MKKIVAIVAIVLVAIVGISYFIIDSRYEKEEILNEFLVPKDAEIVLKDEEVLSESNTVSNTLFLEWSKANKGLPFDYRLFIKLKGWKEEDSEKYKDGGTSGYYTKNDVEISLDSLKRFCANNTKHA
ncbi:hypothetical protein [Lysinibacillus parviboronicapiens]|uniref:hypothetical protein n=1 Tax=Lysinibacillus parviboronicapiens TaxID=436516 RepID=UPI000D370D08|nr:hypothetical protein [Lysinibacillus parviboronicapiens]